jgi:hypothetical protein
MLDTSTLSEDVRIQASAWRLRRMWGRTLACIAANFGNSCLRPLQLTRYRGHDHWRYRVLDNVQDC